MLRSTSLGVSGERGGRGGGREEERERERREGRKKEKVNMCALFYVILFNHVLRGC